MKPEQLESFHRWFRGYVRGFRNAHPENRSMIDLKEEHTLAVCKEIEDIGQSEGLGADDLALAGTTALFHDVGRFSQFVRHHTFVDMKSEDHATLGVRVLEAEKILDDLPEHEAELVAFCVGHHNRLTVTPQATGRKGFFLRLLRDADKIDILRVFTDYYRKGVLPPADAVPQGLPEKPRVSAPVIESLLDRKMVRMEQLVWQSDFRMLQVGWVFDINFARTFEILAERDYLAWIRTSVPDAPGMDEVFDLARAHVRQRLDSASAARRHA